MTRALRLLWWLWRARPLAPGAPVAWAVVRVAATRDPLVRRARAARLDDLARRYEGRGQ